MKTLFMKYLINIFVLFSFFFFLNFFFFFKKKDDKKNWLPDINKSNQNMGSLSMDDRDSNSSFKINKGKKNDPYSSKAFHMKYQNPFKVSFDITDNKDTFKIREQERKKKKQVKQKIIN